jgi:hypothetical protein
MQDIEAKLREMTVAEKLTFLDEMEVSAHKHNDIELRRQITVWRQRIRSGEL